MTKNLKIQQDLPFQYRHWRRERIGWIVIASVIAAALFGLFGHHPLARTTTQTVNRQLAIEYDRYGRYESSAEMLVKVRPETQGDGVIRLWFDAEYLNSVRVVSISPLPVRGEARDGGRDLIIQTDGNPMTVSLSLQFQRVGIVEGRVRISGGEALQVTHYVWP